MKKIFVKNSINFLLRSFRWQRRYRLVYWIYKKKKNYEVELKKKKILWRPKKNKTVFFIFSYSDFKNDMGIFVSNNNYFFWVVGYQPEPHERKIEEKKLSNLKRREKIS